MNIKIFADGADIETILELNQNPLIKGFTTNPTLMRKAGVKDYRGFAKYVLSAISNKPISFEVFADDFFEMERQAREIATWGDNVYVKIPVTNTKGESSSTLIRTLSHDGIQLNVTAITTVEQVDLVCKHLSRQTPSYVSVFAGRIADTGVNPTPTMERTRALICWNLLSNTELIWASPRQLLDVLIADEMGCDIITVTSDILKKMELIGKDLTEYSLDTVKMFYNDAVKSGFKL